VITTIVWTFGCAICNARLSDADGGLGALCASCKGEEVFPPDCMQIVAFASADMPCGFEFVGTVVEINFVRYTIETAYGNWSFARAAGSDRSIVLALGAWGIKQAYLRSQALAH
jgi:hypothetical protein